MDNSFIPHVSYNGDLNILTSFTSQLLYQRVNKIDLSGTSLLNFTLGIPKNTNMGFRGRFYVGSCVEWRIENEDTIIAGSCDKKNHIRQSCDYIEGKTIRALDIDVKTFDIHIYFDENTQLHLFTVKKYPTFQNQSCWGIQRFGIFSVLVRPDRAWRFTDLQNIDNNIL